jgi:hypothetical protein
MGTVVVEEEKPFSALKKARQAQRTPLCSGCPTHRSPGRRILSSRARPNSTTTALSLPLFPSPVTLTLPQLSMANPRQRSKARSKTHRAIRTTSKQKAKKVTVKGPAALVENWDTKKTVLQKWVQRAGGCGCGGCTGEREGLSGRARRAVRSPTVPLSETRALHLVSLAPRARSTRTHLAGLTHSLPRAFLSYKRLGLLSSLARHQAGGIEPTLGEPRRDIGDHPFMDEDDNDKGEGSSTSGGRIPKGYGRIVRDAEGNVLDIVMAEDQEEEAEEVKDTKTDVVRGESQSLRGVPYLGRDSETEWRR